jgi:alpha-amylase/alpha-mannosidase (GH57 family)
MNTETHTPEIADSTLLAYGKEVAKLLSSSGTENWTAELWTIFTGYIISLKEQGHAPELCDTYFSFKELLDFFAEVERIGRGE